MSLFGVDISTQALFGQLLLGLINGVFYAVLSLGLAVIFGLLNVVNFLHGVQYMLGAMIAWLLSVHFGIGYWGALLLAPLAVALFGALFEVTLMRRIYRLDHLYGFLLTFGVALLVQGFMQQYYGSASQTYAIPDRLTGGINLGFMFLPLYRGWVIAAAAAACLATWIVIEKTQIGSWLRAATENAALVRALGVKVPRLRTAVYALGAALAALGGVMAAPIYQVSPLIGSDIIVTVFAVVVAGGMGSIHGSVLAGFLLGLCEGLTKFIYPEAASVVVFVVMALVLLLRPAGLFGKDADRPPAPASDAPGVEERTLTPVTIAILFALTVALPFVVYPLFVLKALCFGLFACSFALLLGYAGLLSFGHAAFFGSAAYVTGYLVKAGWCTPELAVIAGVAAAVVLGLAFGLIAVRRRGIYFAMVTLALSQVVYFYALRAPWTGQDNSLTNIPRGNLFGVISLENTVALYAFVAIAFWLGFLGFYRIIRSPFGQVLRMIRDNEPRAVSLGYDVDRYKIVALALSAGLAGLGGSLKVLVFQLASLTDLYWTMSGEVVLMTLVGGMGTILGPVVGAATMVGVEAIFSELGAWVAIVQGALFAGCVLFLRQGVYGQWLAMLERRRAAAA